MTAARVQSTLPAGLAPIAPIAVHDVRPFPLLRRPRGHQQSRASQSVRTHAWQPAEVGLTSPSSPTASAVMAAKAQSIVTASSPLTAPIVAHAAFPSPHRCRQEFRASQRVKTHADTPPTASAAMAAKAHGILTATSPQIAPIVARAVPISHLQRRRCRLLLHRHPPWRRASSIAKTRAAPRPTAHVMTAWRALPPQPPARSVRIAPTAVPGASKTTDQPPCFVALC